MEQKQIELLVGVGLAALFILKIVGTVLGRIVDDWWEKYSKTSTTNGNGNGDIKRVCYMGQGAAVELEKRLDLQHEGVIAILDRLAAIGESQQKDLHSIALTLAVEEERKRGRRAG